MSDTQKLKPRIIEAGTDTTPEEVVPGSIILNRDTSQVSFDASDGERHPVKDPTKLPLTGGALEGDLNLGTHKITKDYVEGNSQGLDNTALVNKGEVSEMIKSQGSGDVPQSDYEESDETSKSFIKNRPFYKDITQVSGNIVKNPEFLGESIGGYLCDKVGLSKEQSDDLRVTVTDPSSSETVVLKGFVLTCKEADAGLPSDFNNNLVLLAGESIDYASPIIIDGINVDLSTGMPVHDDLHSVAFFDIVVVNTINLAEVKYIDPFYFEPHRPDYNIVDPKDPRYIDNKVVQKSYNETIVTDEGEYWYRENVRVIYDYGVTVRDKDSPDYPNNPKYEGSYILIVNYKDGTTQTYETAPLNSPTASSEVNNDTLSESYRNVYNPDGSGYLCQIKSQFGGILDKGDSSPYNDEYVLFTFTLIVFDQEIYPTIESWSLSGEFVTVNLITKDMVNGLNEDLDSLRQEIESKDEVISNLQAENSKLRELDSQTNLIVYRSIKEILRGDSSDLRGYLRSVTLRRPTSERGLLSGDTTAFSSETYLPIKATNLSECFSNILSKLDEEYVDGSSNYDAAVAEMKLLNAEIIDRMLFQFNIDNYYNITKSGFIRVMLCHDVVSANSSFYLVSGPYDRQLLKEFTLTGDPALGRRVKFSGCNSDTFRLGQSDKDWTGVIVDISNLDFMDSVYFAEGSPIAKSVDLMVNIIDQLHDYSADGQPLPGNKYCTFGSSGLDLLSEEQKKVAEDKGWRLN